MQLKKLLTLTMSILMLYSFAFVPFTIADDPSENIISASFDIELESATDLKIDVSIVVTKITLPASGTSYTGAEIATISTTDSETMGSIKYALKAMLKEQIDQIFPEGNADITILNKLPSYTNEVFQDEYNINLTSGFFGMNESVNTYDFVNGVLYMGAIANYSFDLQANTGWANTYSISLRTPMLRHYTNGDETANVIQWQVDNSNGMHPTTLAKLQLKNDNYGNLRLHSEDITLEFELDTRDLDKTNLRTNILAKNIDIRNYDILPDFVNKLDFVPSDGIRMFIDNGLLADWDDFYSKTIETIRDRTIPIIENAPSFNQTLNLGFTWDSNSTTKSYQIENMNNNTPIKAILTGEDISFEICDISSRALFGLVNTGAQVNISSQDVNFGEGLEAITTEYHYKYDCILYLPENFYLDGNNIYKWNQSGKISGEIRSDVAENHTENEIDTIVNIEMSSADLNLLSFFTGRTEIAFGMSLQENRNYNVTTIPDSFSLPQKIQIEYLNADAFRLCLEENVFREGDVTNFLNAEKTLFENRLENIFSPDLEVEGLIDKDVFDQSLEWDGDIMKMDGNPIVVKSYAHSSYPIPFEISLIPPSFKINTLTYNFTSMQKQSVTYKMFFPRGTTIEVNDSLNRVVVKESGDGRQYFEIKFDASEQGLTDEITCKIIPSAFFIFGIFMPCILSFVVTVILIIVVLMIRKRRKIGRRIKVPREEEEMAGYEDQDYYIPPPPSSR